MLTVDMLAEEIHNKNYYTAVIPIWFVTFLYHMFIILTTRIVR